MRRKIAVIGLGYVGLPVAVAFAERGFSTVGFEISPSRVAELQRGHDRTNEVPPNRLKASGLSVTADAAALRAADFHIVTVPTPIDSANAPDLAAVRSASKLVGGALKRGDIVVYESTVYPGCTEEDCAPILEGVSGLKSGVDFFLGYSPERINPGDHQHRFETIRKVVSGQTPETAKIVAETYSAVVDAGVHMASSIKVAEAAKVIENTQRDLNIALMNELSLILKRMDVDTLDVLEAAGTKWNFLRFTPGLVGGHCIGVDPYYLTHKAQRLGIHPEVVLAGRRINDQMGQFVARECLRLILRLGRANPVVTLLGVTFKENVPDVRNSKSFDVIRELQAFGVKVQAHDPVGDAQLTEHEYGVHLVAEKDLAPADAIILAVAHKTYVERGWGLIEKLLRPEGGAVLDLKGALPRDGVKPSLLLWRP
jgi:UDP-N-acetyl-D-galactosamine dehydrogenase